MNAKLKTWIARTVLAMTYSALLVAGPAQQLGLRDAAILAGGTTAFVLVVIWAILNS